MTRWLRALTLGGVLGWAGLAPAWAQAPMPANRVASATPATPATTANAARPREAVPDFWLVPALLKKTPCSKPD